MKTNWIFFWKSWLVEHPISVFDNSWQPKICLQLLGCQQACIIVYYSFKNARISETASKMFS
jgi:hypothetical protein